MSEVIKCVKCHERYVFDKAKIHICGATKIWCSDCEVSYKPGSRCICSVVLPEYPCVVEEEFSKDEYDSFINSDQLSRDLQRGGHPDSSKHVGRQQITLEERFKNLSGSSMVDMTPKERVFGTLRNLLSIVRSDKDLNDTRAILDQALDRSISWESELVDKDQVYQIPGKHSDLHQSMRDQVPGRVIAFDVVSPGSERTAISADSSTIQQLIDAAQSMVIIKYLTEREGSTVIIQHDNPDYSPHGHDSSVTWCPDFNNTGHQFWGKSTLDCLRQAEDMKRST